MKVRQYGSGSGGAKIITDYDAEGETMKYLNCRSIFTLIIVYSCRVEIGDVIYTDKGKHLNFKCCTGCFQKILQT